MGRERERVQIVEKEMNWKKGGRGEEGVTEMVFGFCPSPFANVSRCPLNQHSLQIPAVSSDCPSLRGSDSVVVVNDVFALAMTS